MRHENRLKIGFYTFLLIISCAHPICSQPVNTSKTVAAPLVINNLRDYKLSIKPGYNKRLVALENYITPLFTDWKYETINNFTHVKLYENPVAYARLPVALALQKVQKDLAAKGLSLKFFDAYRPYAVTKKMWKIVPDERYAANPAKGSGHNRGTAIDVSLVKISTKQELEMPTDFDDFSEKAHHDYMNLSKEAISNRALLKAIMEKYGFVALATEWWHYSLPNSRDFELLDLDFAELAQLEPSLKE